MNAHQGALQRRKTHLHELLSTLDDLLRKSDPALGTHLKDIPETSLRGFFIDLRTLRAASLKLKMILTLIAKSYALWQESPAIRSLLACPGPYEELIRENPWKPEDTLIIQTRIAPFIYKSYIQPSFKILDISCNGLSGDIVFQGTKPGWDLALWRSLGFPTESFTYLDSLKFIADQISSLLASEASPSVALMADMEDLTELNQEKTVLFDYLAEYLTKTGIRAVLRDAREVTRGASFSLIVNTLPIEKLSALRSSGSLEGFTSYWKAGRVINSGAHPVFSRGILELVTSPHYSQLLGTPPRETLTRMIPWTRILRDGKTISPAGREVSLPEFVLEARNSLLIRPAFESPGERIVAGAACTAGDWELHLKKAIEIPSGFVVQETIELPEALLPVGRDGSLTWEKGEFWMEISLNERADIGGACAMTTLGEPSRLLPSSIVIPLLGDEQ
ncbi:MAG: hypothetical protein RDV48_14175 [Candidatus Eremiobacteraeota bacterium]|nr:hypothetical protein [Candidatus Eremiobacteraeota bacterium]